MNIRCIKTLAGEDIMGDISETLSGKEINIKNPCAIVMIPTSNTQFSIGLAPYMPFAASKEFSFKEEHIILNYEPSAELRNEYSRVMGAGIVVPKNDLSLIK